MKRIAIALVTLMMLASCSKTKKYPIPLFEGVPGTEEGAATVSVSASSNTAVDDVGAPTGTYSVGDEVELTITFKEPVDVTGNPTLELSNGGTATCTQKQPGSTTLTCTYTVQESDSDVSALTYKATDSLKTDDTSSINVAGTTNPADTTLPQPTTEEDSLATAKIQIDTGPPTVSSVQAVSLNGTYKAGDTIQLAVKMSEVVIIDGVPQLEMATGGFATYASGSGTDYLIFNYTIPAGANTADLNYKETTSLVLNGGTIKDATGNDADRTLPEISGSSIATNSDIKIAPSVSSVASSTGNGPFKAGDSIKMEITYDQDITVSGIPTLTLNLPGNPTATCAAHATDPKVLVCTYEVQSTDNITDLDYLNSESLVVNGGSIKGSSGVDADNTLPAPNGNSGSSIAGGNEIVVDTTGPTLTSITSSSDSNIYGTTSTVNITLTFSETLDGSVSGTPITLNAVNGGINKTIPANKCSVSGNQLICSYEVIADDTSNGSPLEVTAVSLTGLTDSVGNAIADATALPTAKLAQDSDSNNIIIDTNAPTVSLSVDGGATSGNEGSTVTIIATLGNLTSATSREYEATLTGTGGSSNPAGSGDYSIPSTPFTFPVGSNNGANQSITVTLADDTIDELDEKLTFGVSGLAIGSTVSNFTINDNDDTPTLTITTLGTITEGSSKTLEFELSHPSSSDTTFDVYSTVDSAVSNDYSGIGTAAAKTTIKIPAGATTPSETVPSGGNTSFTVAATAENPNVFEGAETFTVTVDNVGNSLAAPSGGTQTVTIPANGTKPNVTYTASTLTIAEADAGSSTYFDLTFSNPTAFDPATFLEALIDSGTATKDTDYTISIEGVSSDGNWTGARVKITPLSDDFYEKQENFKFNIGVKSGQDSNASIGTTDLVTVNITDDPADKPSFTISSAELSVGEDDADGETVTLSFANSIKSVIDIKSGVTITPAYTTGTGKAAAADVASIGDVAMVGSAGNYTGISFTAKAQGDDIYEGDESFTYTISSDDLNISYEDTTNNNGDVKITDGESAPDINISSSAGDNGDVNEGSTITYTVSFADSKTAASDVEIPVAISSASSTFKAGDYTLNDVTDGKVTITGGQNSVTFSVYVEADDIDEPTEAITATLTEPTGYTLGTGSVTNNIIDQTDEVTLAFANASENVNEGAISPTINVALSGKSEKTYNFTVSSSDGDTNPATAGSDYTAITNAAYELVGTGSANQTKAVSINATADSLYEGGSSGTKETYKLTLSGGASGTTTVNIVDQDSAPSFSLTGGSNVTKAESAGTYTMTLNSGTALPANKTYTVEYSGSATPTGSGTDYTGAADVTINDGATSGTFDVTIVDDTIYESSETIIVTVKDGTEIVATQTITITDNDFGITAANTMDYDNDGQVDGYQIVFSEEVTDSSFDANAAKWAVANHSNIARKTDYPGDTPNDNTLYISFSEIGVNTAEKPDLTTSSGGGITAAVGGKLLEDLDSATVTEADTVKPIIVSAVGSAGENELTVTYSEPVYTNSGASGAIIASDVTYGNGNAGGGTNITGMGSDTDGSDSVVTYTTDANFVNGDSGDTVAGNANIYDAANNTGNTTPVNLSINISIDGIEIVLRDHTTVETDPNDADFVGALLKMHDENTRGFASKLDSDSSLVNGCSDVTCLMNNVLTAISDEMGAYLKSTSNGGYSLVTRKEVPDALIPTELASLEVKLSGAADEVNDVRNHYVDLIGTKTGTGTVSNLPTSAGGLTSTSFKIEVQASKNAGTGNPGIVLIGITTDGNYSTVEVDLTSLVNGTNVAESGTEKLSGNKNFFSVAAPKLDFLVSVNNSATMVEEQAATRSSLAAFYSRLRNLGADFRMSVVTSDCDQLWAKDTDNFDFTIGQHETCQPAGIGSEEGITDWGSGTKYFSNSAQDEADFNEIFNPVNTLTRGIYIRGYSKEANLLYAEKAIAKSGEDGATANGTFTQMRIDNSRSSVPITLIIISDDPDQYDEVLDRIDDSPDFDTFLPTLPNSVFDKDNNRFVTQNITVHVVSPLDVSGNVANCEGTNGSTSEIGKPPYNGGVDPDEVYGQIVTKTGGMESSICSDAPDAFMELVADQSVAEAIDSTYTLAHMPITNTITVKVNGAAIDMGIATAGSGTTKYIFNSVTRKIAFTGDLPAVGSSITVEYSYFNSGGAMNLPGEPSTLMAYISVGNRKAGLFGTVALLSLTILLGIVLRRRMQQTS